jgi:hypothetical protein
MEKKCERMEQENGREEKQKTTITLKMIIRHDYVSNNSKVKVNCSR